jgi:hypothetical protein
MVSKDEQGATVFEKALPSSWILRKFAFAEIGAPPGRGCYWDGHELKHTLTGTSLLFPEWEWADMDRNRLVWAVDGCLRTADLGEGKLHSERLLYDFNDMKFQAVAAPY